MSRSERARGPHRGHVRQDPHGARRTQQERRSATQTRLLDATAEALADLGWAGLSTTDVSRRAGVSRGAQQHHFPTKMDLVTAALEHLLDKLRHEYELSYADLPPDQRNVAGAIDLFWETMCAPPATALLELCLAGRTDPELRPLASNLNERVIQIVYGVFQDLFPESLPPEISDTAIRALFAMLVGLSLQHSLDDDAHGHQARVLAQVKNLASLLIPPAHHPGPLARPAGPNALGMLLDTKKASQ
jgi:AcrR family transcriptional regulator